MNLKDDLRSVLEAIKPKGQPVDVIVRDSGPGQVIAIVTSDGFEGMDEYDRQNMVWERILAELEDHEHRIEFIFTNAPNDPQDEAA